MCENFIHKALPDGVWLTGAIVKKGKGYIFYRDFDSNLNKLKENLESAGAKDIILFEGMKPKLINRIKSLKSENNLPGYQSITELVSAAIA